MININICLSIYACIFINIYLQVPRLCDHVRAGGSSDAARMSFAGLEDEEDEEGGVGSRLGGAGANKLTIKLYMYYEVRAFVLLSPDFVRAFALLSSDFDCALALFPCGFACTILQTCVLCMC